MADFGIADFGIMVDFTTWVPVASTRTQTTQ